MRGGEAEEIRVPVGSKFGRYEVVKHLARGGMADLSIARAVGIEGFERHVVLKHLRPEESEDASFVQMFATEARLAAALHHHNIVQVHDIGQEAGRHFFAMEYVHGEDLRRVLHQLKLRDQQMPIEHVVTIGIAVASALHYAHEQKGPDRKPLGMVHRDITPGNILIGFDGNVKVVDFGIAKAAHRKGDATTQAGMLKGKVPYMSPEQCSGKAVDRRSDLFSLGILLYETCTVRRLFKGGNEFSTMSAVLGGDIPSPSEVRADLPGKLEAIIMTALTREIDRRYQSADEIRAALDEFADKAGLRTSVSGLATFMRQLFGDRPEPWMDDGEPARLTDFDASTQGLVATPDPTRSHAVVANNDSLIEQARREVTTMEGKPVADPTSELRPEKTVVERKPRKPAAAAASVGEQTQVDAVAAVESTDVEPLSPFAGDTTAVEAPPIIADTAPVPIVARPIATAPPARPTPVPKAALPLPRPPVLLAVAAPPAPPRIPAPPVLPAAPPVAAVEPVAVAPVETVTRSNETAVVSPLAFAEDTASMRRQQPPRRRTWLVGGGVAAVGVVIAIVIAASSSNDAAAVKSPAPVPPAPVATQPAPEADPPMPTATAEPPMPKPVDPTPAPAPPAPDPTPPAPVAQTTDDTPPPDLDPPAKPHATTAKPAVVATQKPHPKPTAVVKPKPPAAKPEAKWDPNALFLKKP